MIGLLCCNNFALSPNVGIVLWSDGPVQRHPTFQTQCCDGCKVCSFSVIGYNHCKLKTSCRRVASTICPCPSPPFMGTEALCTAEQTTTWQ